MRTGPRARTDLAVRRTALNRAIATRHSFPRQLDVEKSDQTAASAQLCLIYNIWGFALDSHNGREYFYHPKEL